MKDPRREHMPDTRSSKTGKAQVDSVEFYVTISFFDDVDRDDARPGEMFIRMSKHGSDLSLMYDALAVMVSVSLQYGVPWQKIKEKFEHSRGSTSDHENPSILHGIIMLADRLISEYRSETQAMQDDVSIEGA